MNRFAQLTERSTDREWMDLHESDSHQLINTLKVFPWINRLLTPCHRLLRRYVLREMSLRPNRSWSLLDLGAGGCDLARWLTARSRNLGIELQVTCIDHDPRVVEYARGRCAGYNNIEIRNQNAATLGKTEERWDFVFSNHFLHHLPDDEVVGVLAAVAKVARCRAVMSDIHRTRLNYWAYSSLLPLRLTNSFAWHDGRTSIRKAFTVRDCELFLAKAGVASSSRVQVLQPGHLAVISEFT